MSNREVWDILGRGSPAGRALFNVYSGDNAGKAAGERFHQRNRRTYERKVAGGWEHPEMPMSSSPKTSSPQATKVAVPKVGRGTRPGVDEVTDERGKTYFHYQLAYGGRRPRSEIIHEMEAEWTMPRPQPLPNRPALDDAEKDRLANLMRWNGKPPEVSPEDVAVHRKGGKRGMAPQETSRLQELEQMFEQTLQEISERREFLDTMRAKGTVGKYDRQIQAEIKQRVEDLKKLDGMIKDEQINLT